MGSHANVPPPQSQKTILLSSPNLKGPGLSSLNSRPSLFAYLPSVLRLSSLSPGLFSPSFRPILPQSQAYVLAVSGLSSRLSFPQFQPIFPQSQSYLPPSPKPNFPQSCSSFVSQLIWSPHWTTTDAVCFFQVKVSSTSRPVQASSLASMPTSPQTPWKIDQARAGGRDLFLPLSAFRFGDVADGCFPSPNLTRSVLKTMGVGQKKPSSCSPCCSLVF